MDPVIREKARGHYGGFSWTRYPGIEAARQFVKGSMPRPSIHHLVGLTPTEAGPGRMTFPCL